MAKEKNTIFAVLAVIVLVTAVGIVYMIKGGPGQATLSRSPYVYGPGAPQEPNNPYTYNVVPVNQQPPVQALVPTKDTPWEDFEYLKSQIRPPTDPGASLVDNLYRIGSSFNQRSTSLQVRFYVGTGPNQDTITAVVGPKSAFTKNPGTVGMVLSTLPNNHRIRNAKIVLIDNISCGSEANALKKTVDTLAAQSNSGSLTFATSDDKANPKIVYANFVDFWSQDVIDVIFG